MNQECKGHLDYVGGIVESAQRVIELDVGALNFGLDDELDEAVLPRVCVARSSTHAIVAVVSRPPSSSIRSWSQSAASSRRSAASVRAARLGFDISLHESVKVPVDIHPLVEYAHHINHVGAGNPVVQHVRSNSVLPVAATDFVAGPSDHRIVHDSFDRTLDSRTYSSA